MQITIDSVETEDERRDRLRITEPVERLLRHALDLRDRGLHSTGVVAARRSVALCPDAPQAWNTLGSLEWNRGAYDAALFAFNRAMALDANDASIHGNFALCLHSMGRHEEAQFHYGRALAIEPGNVHIKWDQAISQLAAGDWERGLDGYELRMEFRSDTHPRMPYPVWEGEDLAGKTLFVHAEQGMGDRVLFHRYVAWVLDTWPTCTVKLAMGDNDMPSLGAMFYGVHPRLESVPAGARFPEADFGIYLVSLPRIHGSRPGKVPPDPGWIRDLSRRNGEPYGIVEPLVPAIKVGVAWTGSTTMLRNADRTIPVEMMIELNEIPTVQLYNLQFPPGRADLDRIDGGAMAVDLTREIAGKGIIGSAAIMTKLDMVVTACTSIAHIAGSLGIPTFVLLCYDPYWVWLRGRHDSIWYPSVRLFRQPSPGDWRSVVEDVKVELAAAAAAKLRGQ